MDTLGVGMDRPSDVFAYTCIGFLLFIGLVFAVAWSQREVNVSSLCVSDMTFLLFVSKY